MILTSCSVETKRLTSETIALLKSCDDISTFTEAGWFFAYGWKDKVLIVKVHCNSLAEYENAMGLRKPDYHKQRRWESR